MMTDTDLMLYVGDCKYKDWNICLRYDDTRPYIQVQFAGKDTITGALEIQSCRKWMLSYYMTKTEVIETVFAALERAVVHELRDTFSYKGRKVFSNHRDIGARWEIAIKDNVDVRE